jgi:hypothetical protein
MRGRITVPQPKLTDAGYDRRMPGRCQGRKSSLLVALLQSRRVGSSFSTNSGSSRSRSAPRRASRQFRRMASHSHAAGMCRARRGHGPCRRCPDATGAVLEKAHGLQVRAAPREPVLNLTTRTIPMRYRLLLFGEPSSSMTFSSISLIMPEPPIARTARSVGHSSSACEGIAGTWLIRGV